MLTQMSRVFLLFLLLWTVPAVAHEKAVLSSPESSVTAGGILTLRGSDFGKDETYRLKLTGALTEYDLGEVTADRAGVFSVEIQLPRGVRSGTYRVIAVAPDGDEVASLDLTVAGSSPPPGAEAEHKLAVQDTPEHSAQTPAARADEMPIQRPRSGIEWGIIGLLVGLSGGLGVSLLRVSRAD